MEAGLQRLRAAEWHYIVITTAKDAPNRIQLENKHLLYQCDLKL